MKPKQDCSTKLLVLLALLLCSVANAFLTSSTTVTVPSRLFAYRSEFGEGGRPSKPIMRGLTVPLLAPIPGAGPLLLGGEMVLDPPTPMQWASLEEAVTIHRKYLKQQSNDDDVASNLTAIDAAPLVAVIDEVTATMQHKSGFRYATLAAVVGISKTSEQQRQPTIDTSSETSFMESMNEFGSKDYVSPLASRIRLVGVGRAFLKDFFHQTPTLAEDQDVEDSAEEEEDDDDDDDEDDDDDDVEAPIVMTVFQLLQDTSETSNSPNLIGNKGARSSQMAPVFAISRMFSLANRVVWAHDDRRRLVAGLVAAQHRLENVHSMFQDMDGIGSVVSASREEEEEAVQDLLTRYSNPSNRNDLEGAERLATLPNYGLTPFAALSSISQLTDYAMSHIFEPYYSPKRRETEEYRLEIMSFIAFRALEGFVQNSDLSWALHCSNSAERLEKAYDLMLQHVGMLSILAERASSDLRECGEECDLW